MTYLAQVHRQLPATRICHFREKTQNGNQPAIRSGFVLLKRCDGSDFSDNLGDALEVSYDFHNLDDFLQSDGTATPLEQIVESRHVALILHPCILALLQLKVGGLIATAVDAPTANYTLPPQHA